MTAVATAPAAKDNEPQLGRRARTVAFALIAGGMLGLHDRLDRAADDRR